MSSQFLPADCTAGSELTAVDSCGNETTYEWIPPDRAYEVREIETWLRRYPHFLGSRSVTLTGNEGHRFFFTYLRYARTFFRLRWTRTREGCSFHFHLVVSNPRQILPPARWYYCMLREMFGQTKCSSCSRSAEKEPRMHERACWWSLRLERPT